MDFKFTGPPLTDPVVMPTPFSREAAKANSQGSLSVWAQYALPHFFSGAKAELNATRNTAMIEDKSPLVSTVITGPDAEKIVNKLITRDATKIEINHAYYTPWVDHEGKVIVEGLVFRLSETDFILTANAMTAWLEENRGDLNVEFADITGQLGILALQGPASEAILEKVTGESWSDLRFSRGRESSISGATVHVWRTGFTGGKGYELWVPPAAGNDVWATLMEHGAPLGLEPCGHVCQDIARVEAGLVLPGIDYARAGPDAATKAHGFGISGQRFLASPYEIDLGRFVDFKKGDFVGRAALEAEKAAGTSRKMMGMKVNWQKLVRDCADAGQLPVFGDKVRRFPPLDVSVDGKTVGFASSITWSEEFEAMIGFAHMPPELATAGKTVSLAWQFGEKVFDAEATLVETPFLKVNHG